MPLGAGDLEVLCDQVRMRLLPEVVQRVTTDITASTQQLLQQHALTARAATHDICSREAGITKQEVRTFVATSLPQQVDQAEARLLLRMQAQLGALAGQPQPAGAPSEASPPRLVNAKASLPRGGAGAGAGVVPPGAGMARGDWEDGRRYAASPPLQVHPAPTQYVHPAQQAPGDAATSALVVATSERVDGLATHVAALTGQVAALQDSLVGRVHQLGGECDGLRADCDEARSGVARNGELVRQLAEDALARSQHAATRMADAMQSLHQAVVEDVRSSDSRDVQQAVVQALEPRLAELERVVAAEETRASRWVAALCCVVIRGCFW